MKVFRLEWALSVLSGLSLFVVPALSDLQASSLFEMPAEGKDGSCDTDKVDMMVNDAATLADKAIASLDKLLNGERTIMFSKNMLENNNDNQRLARLAFAMWGVKIDEPMIFRGKYFRVVSDDRSRLETARANFDLVKQKLYSGQVDDAKLVCGDKDWEYATTFGDLGYDIEDLRDEPIQGQGQPGVYYSKKWAVKKPGTEQIDTSKSILIAEDGLDGKPLCTPPTAGETWAAFKLVMMCTSSFDRKSFAERYAAQDDLKSGESVDDQQTAGAEFLHEMMHFINKGITDRKLPTGNGGQRAAYYWENTVALAMLSQDENDPDPDLALKNADNYRTYALAIALDRVDWNEEGEKP